MKKAETRVLEARKTPVQARSAATVEAILEATIQVLLEAGPERLTTTRVAERAGASVGTLYQYFPNKQSVLYAVLEMHLGNVQKAVQAACHSVHGQPLERMAEVVALAFVEAKMQRADASAALYRIAATVEMKPLLVGGKRRSVAALTKLLETAPDARFADVAAVAETLYGAMVGAVRATMESGATPKMVKSLREQLVVLCAAYLAAAGGTAGRAAGRAR